MKKSPHLVSTETADSAQIKRASPRPSRADAEAAVRTLLAWAGDNPDRPGLAATPARVVEAYREYFAGYEGDAAAELSAAIDDDFAYDDMVVVSGIHFESHCEHHIAPFFGEAHVAYVPKARIVGLSKLARVVEIFARRLQTQEALTSEIALTIEKALDARGVAVLIRARHQCVSARSVNQANAITQTSRFLGVFDGDAALQSRFLAALAPPAVSA